MVKGNQTNITDSTLFTMQLNYTPTYNLHHIKNCMQYVCVFTVCVCVCVCVCVRARASTWLRLLCVHVRVCVIAHVCVRSCVCEAVLILYAILIRPRHTSQLFIIIF